MQVILVSEGFDTSLWEELVIAEMLAGGISDSSLFGAHIDPKSLAKVGPAIYYILHAQAWIQL